MKKTYAFGTVGYFSHKGRDYPCVVVDLSDDGLGLYHQGGLIFPERNLPLTASPSEFRPDPRAAKWITDRQMADLDVRARKD